MSLFELSTTPQEDATGAFVAAAQNDTTTVRGGLEAATAARDALAGSLLKAGSNLAVHITTATAELEKQRDAARQATHGQAPQPTPF